MPEVLWCRFGTWSALPEERELGSSTLRQHIKDTHQHLHQTAAALCQRQSAAGACDKLPA